MRLLRYEDTAGYEHDQAPEFMVSGCKGKWAMDELIQDQACAGASQSKANYSIIIWTPVHSFFSLTWVTVRSANHQVMQGMARPRNH
jgi:hypothetical protein